MNNQWQQSGGKTGMSAVQLKELADDYLGHIETMAGYEVPDKEKLLAQIQIVVSKGRQELSAA